jgi:hypothetical protein
MTDTAMDNQVLLRRTLVTATTMLGGCVLIVGTVTLIALTIVGHAVAPPESDTVDAGAATAVTARGKIVGVPPVPTTTKAK